MSDLICPGTICQRLHSSEPRHGNFQSHDDTTPSRTVVIHQPDFLPYLGFFHRLLHADLFVVLDTVQFLSGSKRWHNRDKIRTREGAVWLTVPVHKSPQKTPIHSIVISDETNWRSRHLNLLFHHYHTAPFFNEIIPFIDQLYSGSEKMLSDFTFNSIKILIDLFDIRIDVIKSSEINAEGKANELLVDILRKTGAKTYLSGLGAKAYFDPEPFRKDGISVSWQKFQHPEYKQVFSPFIPFLSSIDLFLNCGIEASRKILRSC